MSSRASASRCVSGATNAEYRSVRGSSNARSTASCALPEVPLSTAACAAPPMRGPRCASAAPCAALFPLPVLPGLERQQLHQRPHRSAVASGKPARRAGGARHPRGSPFRLRPQAAREHSQRRLPELPGNRVHPLAVAEGAWCGPRAGSSSQPVALLQRPHRTGRARAVPFAVHRGANGLLPKRPVLPDRPTHLALGAALDPQRGGGGGPCRQVRRPQSADRAACR